MLMKISFRVSSHYKQNYSPIDFVSAVLSEQFKPAPESMYTMYSEFVHSIIYYKIVYYPSNNSTVWMSLYY